MPITVNNRNNYSNQNQITNSEPNTRQYNPQIFEGNIQMQNYNNAQIYENNLTNSYNPIENYVSNGGNYNMNNNFNTPQTGEKLRTAGNNIFK